MNIIFIIMIIIMIIIFTISIIIMIIIFTISIIIVIIIFTISIIIMIINIMIVIIVYYLVFSFDRYCAIVNPLSHQLTHSKAWAGIVAIWTLSVATAYPQFHFSETVQIESNSTAVQCLMIFPDGLFGTYFLV